MSYWSESSGHTGITRPAAFGLDMMYGSGEVADDRSWPYRQRLMLTLGMSVGAPWLLVIATVALLRFTRKTIKKQVLSFYASYDEDFTAERYRREGPDGKHGKYHVLSHVPEAHVMQMPQKHLTLLILLYGLVHNFENLAQKDRGDQHHPTRRRRQPNGGLRTQEVAAARSALAAAVRRRRRRSRRRYRRYRVCSRRGRGAAAALSLLGDAPASERRASVAEGRLPQR